MKKGIFFLGLTALVVGVVFSLNSCNRAPEPGTSGNPIKFYFMPLKGEEKFTRNAPVFKNFIESRTGLNVETIHAPTYLAIIKSLSVGKADIAIMNTLGFLMARDWTRTEAHLKLLYGEEGVAHYQGEVIVRIDSGVRSLQDLNGKTVAFSDPFSSSGYLYPLKLLQENGVKPAKIVMAGGNLKAVELVYNGEVDAAATYYEAPDKDGKPQDARIQLLTQYPDVLEKVQIVSLTDKIPNGPIALRSTLPATIKTKLVGALIEFVRTEEGRKAFKDLYNVTGLALADDGDYDTVQKIVVDLGKTTEELIPGGLDFYKTHVELGLAN